MSTFLDHIKIFNNGKIGTVNNDDVMTVSDTKVKLTEALVIGNTTEGVRVYYDSVTKTLNFIFE